MPSSLVPELAAILGKSANPFVASLFTPEALAAGEGAGVEEEEGVTAAAMARRELGRLLEAIFSSGDGALVKHVR